MKMARFIIDTHVHAQRFAAGKAAKEKLKDKAQGTRDYSGLQDEIRLEIEPFDNSPRLLYDMDCYGVDMCVLLSAFNMKQEMDVETMNKNPKRFVCLCRPERNMISAQRRETVWDPKEVAKELDELLATGDYAGIGETMPHDPMLGKDKKRIDIHSRLEECAHYMEVARKHKVPIRWHTGICMGYPTTYCRDGALPDTFNAMWVHDLASEWPDVPIILEHGGIQGWWWERWYEDCLNVCAATDNVYMETGLWWTELYEKAVADPNIGAKKLLWGTDWGASIPFVYQPGRYPQTYASQYRKAPPVRHQVDFFGWSLKQIGRLNMPQDDINLILGGNAARIYKIEMPHTRLFPFVD